MFASKAPVEMQIIHTVTSEPYRCEWFLVHTRLYEKEIVRILKQGAFTKYTFREYLYLLCTDTGEVHTPSLCCSERSRSSIFQSVGPVLINLRVSVLSIWSFTLFPSSCAVMDVYGVFQHSPSFWGYETRYRYSRQLKWEEKGWSAVSSTWRVTAVVRPQWSKGTVNLLGFTRPSLAMLQCHANISRVSHLNLKLSTFTDNSATPIHYIYYITIIAYKCNIILVTKDLQNKIVQILKIVYPRKFNLEKIWVNMVYETRFNQWQSEWHALH